MRQGQQPLALELPLFVQRRVAEGSGADRGERVEQGLVGRIKRLGLGPPGNGQPARLTHDRQRCDQLAGGLCCCQAGVG